MYIPNYDTSLSTIRSLPTTQASKFSQAIDSPP